MSVHVNSAPMVVFLASHEPSEEQAQAGNYRKAHRRFAALDIAVENKAGTVRRGTNRNGTSWETRMLFDYGYFKRTEGVDGDQVDCFLGPNELAPLVYVITTRKYGAWDQVDEQKCMLGFDSAEDAKHAFLAHYDDPRHFGDMVAMPLEEFRDKVKATREKPVLIKALESGVRLVLLLKATTTKVMQIPGYHKRDGTYVPAHAQAVHYNPEHDPEAVAAGGVSASQKAAHAKLVKKPGWNELAQPEKWAHVLSAATKIQIGWSQAAQISTWKKAAFAGKNPSPAEWGSFAQLPQEKQTALLDEVIKKTGGKTEHLQAPNATVSPAQKVAELQAVPANAAPAQKKERPAVSAAMSPTAAKAKELLESGEMVRMFETVGDHVESIFGLRVGDWIYRMPTPNSPAPVYPNNDDWKKLEQLDVDALIDSIKNNESVWGSKLKEIAYLADHHEEVIKWGEQITAKQQAEEKAAKLAQDEAHKGGVVAAGTTGPYYMKVAYKKLSSEPGWSDLPGKEQEQKLDALYHELQGAASAAAAVSGYVSSLKAGKVPTLSQTKAALALPPGKLAQKHKEALEGGWKPGLMAVADLHSMAVTAVMQKVKPSIEEITIPPVAEPAKKEPRLVLPKTPAPTVVTPAPAPAPSVVAKMPRVSAMTLYTNTTPGHNKWWAISVDDNTNTVFTRWGPLGKKGQSLAKTYPSYEAAAAASQKQVDEKTANGYVLEHAQPKEGDTKLEDGVTYVLRGGRWHKPPPVQPPPKKVVVAKPKKTPAAIAKIEAVDPAILMAWLNGPITPAEHIETTLGAPLPSAKARAWVVKFGNYYKTYDNTKQPKAKKRSLGRALGAAFGFPGETLLTDGTWIDASVNGLSVAQIPLIETDPVKVKAAAIARKTAELEGKAATPKETSTPKVVVTSEAAADWKANVYDPSAAIAVDGWTQVGPQGGYNPGGVFRDPKTGEDWYVKFAAGGEDVVRNEMLANKLYALAGVQVPELQRVTKGGKIGVGSKMVTGLKKDKTALLTGKAPGIFMGFAADAWLANWDAVGNNPAAGKGYDNIQIAPDGTAWRIDAGGALLYGGAGGKKGEFGNDVIELATMRDPKKNPHTAAVFAKMTPADITASVAKIAAISDEAIEAAVMANGPSDTGARERLAAKLIARKQNMIGQYPGAAKAKAKPTKTEKPDPTALKVKIEDLPTAHDFMNWQGTGKPISDKPYVQQNIADEKALLDFAMKGNLVALKAYKYQPVDKMTGQPAGERKSMDTHPSAHVRQFYDDLVLALDLVANPAEPLRLLTAAVKTIAEMAEHFKPFDYGVSVAKAPANQRLGFWIALGAVAEPKQFVPPKIGVPFTPKEKAAAPTLWSKLPAIVRGFLQSVQGSGSANQPYRDGKETDHSGRNCREVVSKCYASAVAHPPGTTIYKWINIESSMMKQLMAAPDGTVFQNPGSMCCSYAPNATTGFGSHRVTIHYAPGAVAMDTFGSGSYSGEKEVTTLPGARFMILSKKNEGHLELEVLMLPPDKTYLDHLGVKGMANG